MQAPVPAYIPPGVGYSFTFANLKVTVLENCIEWQAKLRSDAEKHKKWLEDEKKVFYSDSTRRSQSLLVNRSPEQSTPAFPPSMKHSIISPNNKFFSNTERGQGTT